MARLLIIGTGLIGGSFASAMRRASAFDCIEGFDIDEAVAARALRARLVDRVVDDLDRAVVSANAVMVAVPTRKIAQIVERIAPNVATDAAVFDAGSVKGSVVAALRSRGEMPAWFVPGHPMAGSERGGPESADAALFRDRPVILTPQPETDPGALAKVRSWWSATGATVFESTADVHDEMVALTSHAPHVIAYAFMNWVAAPHRGDARAFAGPGLADFTRIAASDPGMWRDILTENRAAVLAQLDGASAALARIVAALRDGRDDELERLLTAARDARLRVQGRWDAER